MLAEVDLALSRSAVVLTVEGGMIDEFDDDEDDEDDEDSDDPRCVHLLIVCV